MPETYAHYYPYHPLGAQKYQQRQYQQQVQIDYNQLVQMYNQLLQQQQEIRRVDAFKTVWDSLYLRETRDFNHIMKDVVSGKSITKEEFELLCRE